MTAPEPRPTRRGVLVAAALGGLAACSSGGGAEPEPPSPGSPAGSASVPSGSPSGSPSGAAPTRADWAQLGRSVQGSLVLPSDPGYDQVRLLENPRYDGEKPLAVLSVHSPQDVAAGLAFAHDHAVPVAIRSGGHGYPGWSAGGSPPALVIDCRPLSEVHLDGATATIGSGAALASVYDTLGSRGRAIAAGSCATVGIAGLTLGGGVGVLTRAFGLTCDAVTSMQVVTADGSVRTVSTQEEPDLFWALRGGGGGHLGVVTSFALETSAAPTLQTVYLQWPVSAAPQVIEAWQSWAPGADDRLWSTLKALGGSKHAGGAILQLSGTWTGPASAFDQQLAALLDHVPTPTTRSTHSHSYRDAMMSYAGCASIPVAQCTTGPGGSLTREAFAATSHVAYDPLTSAGIDDLLSQVDAAQSSGLQEAGISIDALGGKVRDIDPDGTAFVHRSALATVQYTATFPPGTAGHADDYVHGFRAAMVPHWGNHAYVNYADATISDYQDAYFGANAARLAQVRSTYDPDGFFTQPQDF
ncbi:MAG TPA: FAD-binding oxidoreductase [Nocardioides sp.]|uniref:FAD-binding oxidoreductase n=1 Tax=Nocardioides sp. TaxID=35761 RepID=UPI002E36D4C8|nr:FAD-binding oxidoreductase [Nocardioides sp.]HEX5088471.1 FAD-binding oxidoreductase [Nocardioides sp.]